MKYLCSECKLKEAICETELKLYCADCGLDAARNRDENVRFGVTAFVSAKMTDEIKNMPARAIGVFNIVKSGAAGLKDIVKDSAGAVKNKIKDQDISGSVSKTKQQAGNVAAKLQLLLMKKAGKLTEEQYNEEIEKLKING